MDAASGFLDLKEMNFTAPFWLHRSPRGVGCAFWNGWDQPFGSLGSFPLVLYSWKTWSYWLTRSTHQTKLKAAVSNSILRVTLSKSWRLHSSEDIFYFSLACKVFNIFHMPQHKAICCSDRTKCCQQEQVYTYGTIPWDANKKDMYY